MPTNNRSQAELFQLWFAVHHETATDEQIEELNRLIVEDSEARKQLHGLANQQAWLMWQAAKSGEPAEGVEPEIANPAKPIVFPTDETAGGPFIPGTSSWMPFASF